MAARDKTDQTRQKIIQATDDLLYHKGFNLMSFSDIAEASDVPRGNIYYYFKTKDEVLTAVIQYRISQMKNMLDEWNKTIPGPLERLKRYTRIPLNEMHDVIQYGCPIGTLNSELGKVQRELQIESKQPLTIFKRWIKKQFNELIPNADAESLTTHFLVRTQGLAMIAYIYKDEKIIQNEVKALNQWLDQLAS
ncbi:hypothetical protein MNBD_GAMMA21-1525 [hydrothermal vent metagenome]|uniref:HTH tetR-type domain-containing protein n=1 Tax=hydrothermal vent metagenome TaxID=652676 RepID=A0A3B1AP69_9ZZZZ